FHVADVTLDRDSMEMVCHLARQQRGDVYVQAEQLDGEDIALDGLNALYRRVGLFRSRRVIAVFRQTEELPCFAAIIWRGPLGMNFSFLENRCDLLAVNEKSAREGLAAAWPTLCEFYDDFLPGFIPFVVAPEQARAILEIGAEEICQYTQSIWLRDGFPAWYSHVASQFPLWAPQFPERGPQRDGESSSVERERQQ
ncbi:MAG: hypothetical protein KDA80_08415, partial [Planctomycetaceae bacterium]|nr:hypothetical protein [Planctomycetaceae bacterium]